MADRRIDAGERSLARAHHVTVSSVVNMYRRCHLTTAFSRRTARLRSGHRARTERCAPPAAEAERYADKKPGMNRVVFLLVLAATVAQACAHVPASNTIATPEHREG